MLQPRHRLSSRSRGFSLIELTLAILITSIATIVPVAMITSVQESKRMRARNLVIDQLRAARDRAVWNKRAVHVWRTASGQLEVRDVKEGYSCSWLAVPMCFGDTPVATLNMNPIVSSATVAGVQQWDFCVEPSGFIVTDEMTGDGCVSQVVVTMRATGAPTDDIITIQPTGTIRGNWEPPAGDEGLASVDRHGSFLPDNHDVHHYGANCTGSPYPV